LTGQAVSSSDYWVIWYQCQTGESWRARETDRGSEV